MSAKFKFKVGMQFTSLEQFKKAIRDHSVLNGREVTFPKNDSVRVRGVCKKKCGFVVLCSKVGGKHTFSIKTLKADHLCGRVFNNKSATSKWIASKLIDKVRIARKVRVNEIVDEVKVGFSCGITRWRARRAR